MFEIHNEILKLYHLYLGKTNELDERYYTNELSFIRPKGFLDQTFHILSQVKQAPNPFSIVINKKSIRNNESLDEIAQHILNALKN